MERQRKTRSQHGFSWIVGLVIVLLMGTLLSHLIFTQNVKQDLDKLKSQTPSLVPNTQKTNELELKITKLAEYIDNNRGPQGWPGIIGPKGDRGSQGERGLPGDSPYAVADERLSDAVTKQGNSFNGASQLIKTTLNSELPALSGANLSNLNASAISSGALADSRLSSNVALLNANQTISGNNTHNGTNLFKNSVNSAAAFQIQNDNGTMILLTADTRPTSNLLGNSSLESTTSPWTGIGFLGPAGVLSNNTSNAYVGSGSMQIVTSTGSGGAAYSLSLAPSTTYTFSVYAKATTTFSNFELGHINNGTTNTCATALTLTTGWARYSCTFTTNSNPVSPVVYVRDTAGSHTFYIDAVLLEVSSSAGSYGDAGAINTGVPFMVKSTSTMAFQVQDSSNITLFSVDTVGRKLVSGIPDGTAIVGFTLNTPSYALGKLLVVQNGGADKFTLDKDGNIYLSSTATTISFGASGNSTGVITHWFTCTTSTIIGDVVAIDQATMGRVVSTTTANSPLVAGVIKTANASGGQPCEVAFSGVIQVNVITSGAVSIGDRLVTSTTAGQAMTNNTPATSTVVGKALSSKSAGMPGSVWILLDIQ